MIRRYVLTALVLATPFLFAGSDGDRERAEEEKRDIINTLKTDVGVARERIAELERFLTILRQKARRQPATPRDASVGQAQETVNSQTNAYSLDEEILDLTQEQKALARRSAGISRRIAEVSKTVSDVDAFFPVEDAPLPAPTKSVP
jgi:hypothetical protein